MNRLLGIIDSGASKLSLLQNTPSVSVRPHEPTDGFAAVRELLAAREGPIGNGRAQGEGVFDFRYGPFTGGVPEAGVFHLSTYGEKILAVEIDTSFKRRGIEHAMVGAPVEEGARWAQSVCGSFAFAHSAAYCRAVESALGILPPLRDRRLRLIGIELERIYNHLLVITRLSQAAAQKVLDAHLGALFEEALRINRLFGGARLLSGVNRVGGCAIESIHDAGLAARVAALRGRFERLYEISLSNRNYLDRLHLIGVVDPELAVSCSLTGPSLRASGIGVDLRSAEPLLERFTPVTKTEGDALARMEVRAEEILQSCDLIRAQLDALTLPEPRDGSPVGASRAESGASAAGGAAAAGAAAAGAAAAGAPVAGAPAAGAAAAGAAESPTGSVVWYVEVEAGRIARAYVSTPSLFGFRVFAQAMTGHIFTDFPFAFESFGLSFADAAR